MVVIGNIRKKNMLRKLQYKGNVKKQRVALFLLLAYVVLVTSGLENVNWNPTYGGWVTNIVSLGLLGYLLYSRPKGKQFHFRTLVLFLIWVPFVSILNSWSIYSQSPSRSFLLMTTQSTWVIYFLLHKYKVQEQVVLKVFFYIAYLLAELI